MTLVSRIGSVFLTIALFVLSSVTPRTQQKVTVAVWGDSRENLDDACEEIAAILLKDSTQWDVQVHTGDFTHDGSAASWERSFGYKGVAQLFAPGRTLMCTSNHDAGGENGTVNDKKAAWDAHTRGILPTNEMDHTTHFSAWHRGNVHVVLLDAFFTDSLTMQHWLDLYLKNITPGDWVLAVWHEPAYTLTYKKGCLPICRGWLESLAHHRGVFVLNGHAHLYVRTRPLTPEGTVNAATGIVHIINGTGGASWKEPADHDLRVAFTPSTRSFPCITFLTFTGDTASVRTIDARPDMHERVIDDWRWVRSTVDPR